jgi:hypothetical protein
MDEIHSIPKHESKLGDTAVDGLFYGIAAGMVMAIFLVLGGALTGENPASLLTRFSMSSDPGPLTGLLSHIAMSSVYGILFSLAYQALKRFRPWSNRLPAALVAGLAYGLVLWLGAEIIFVDRIAVALKGIPGWQFLAAHLIYGLILGRLVYRKQNLSET